MTYLTCLTYYDYLRFKFLHLISLLYPNRVSLNSSKGSQILFSFQIIPIVIVSVK